MRSVQWGRLAFGFGFSVPVVLIAFFAVLIPSAQIQYKGFETVIVAGAAAVLITLFVWLLCSYFVLRKSKSEKLKHSLP